MFIHLTCKGESIGIIDKPTADLCLLQFHDQMHVLKCSFLIVGF